ncbi:MAG: aminoacyl-tRNA hydrolase [Betaproteobacteria bacterium]|nr:aminoacyl-tRNA hydrolase [Betaproteobacteria bacterium]
METIRLIVGLGNPGREYERTRHNAGYWWVDAIAHERGARWAKETKFSGWVARVTEGGKDFWLLKPATYMNESGRSVGAFLRFHRIEAPGMLVVHDELDLAPGTVKLKFGGGTGGHNGLRDIDEVLSTRDFWRLRIGIGHPGNKDIVADYVLHEARREEREAIEPAFDRSLGLLSRIATGRMNDATTWLHTLPKPEPDPSAKPATAGPAKSEPAVPAKARAQNPKDEQ